MLDKKQTRIIQDKIIQNILMNDSRPEFKHRFSIAQAEKPFRKIQEDISMSQERNRIEILSIFFFTNKIQKKSIAKDLQIETSELNDIFSYNGVVPFTVEMLNKVVSEEFQEALLKIRIDMNKRLNGLENWTVTKFI